MSDEARRILDLLAQGKITVDEADQLLKAAAGASEPSAGPAPRADTARGKFLRINVKRAASQWRPEKEVDIRVPISMLRSGIRLGAIVPGAGDRIRETLRARGIDVDWATLDDDDVDALLKDLGELTFDVRGDRAAKITIARE